MRRTWRSWGSSRVGLGVAFALAGAGSAQAQNQPVVVDEDHPQARALRVETAPVIDGVLEELWQAAEPIGELRQIEPQEGVPPSESSDIRILYDRDTLYIALRCYDRDPAGIIGTQRARDADLDPDDRVEILIDSFLDRRNAFFFQINPSGSKGDALITNNGQDFNKPWDGIWEGKARVDEEGWSAELAIPFKTMNFREGLDTWGLQVTRHIKRRNEVARWASPDRDIGFFQISEAGTLTGLEGMRQGIGLDVVPFFVSDWSNDQIDDDDTITGDVGADIFFKVTPNLTLSVTLNTDFAEAESDSRRINLTRFPLFFPERRDFFLQDAGQFEFGNAGRDLIPFFSRRVGLADGEEVPILAGAKLTGRQGPYNIGVLDVQTEEESLDSGEDLDSKNLFVTRVSRNVGEQSYVGGIFTGGNPTADEDNYLVGFDANYRTTSFLGDKTFTASAFVLRSESEEPSGEDDFEDEWAYGARVAYPNDVWRWDASILEIQEDFNPALGFVPRSDIRQYESSVTYRPRINDVIRRLEFQLEAEVVTDVGSDVETVEAEIQPFGIQWESGDRVQVEVEHNHEDLTEDFDIREDVTIPIGDYDFTRFRLEIDTADKRPLSTSLAAEGGEFFDGHRDRYRGTLTWRPNALYNGSVEYEYNDIRLPDGDFNTKIARVRSDFAFTPDVSWFNFIQWDSDSDSVGVNSRLRWIPVPGRELFFVFNQTLDTDDTVATEFQELTFKVSYTFRF